MFALTIPLICNILSTLSLFIHLLVYSDPLFSLYNIIHVYDYFYIPRILKVYKFIILYIAVITSISILINYPDILLSW